MKHRTPIIEHRAQKGKPAESNDHSMFGVQCWMFSVFRAELAFFSALGWADENPPLEFCNFAEKNTLYHDKPRYLATAPFPFRIADWKGGNWNDPTI